MFKPRLTPRKRLINFIVTQPIIILYLLNTWIFAGIVPIQINTELILSLPKPSMQKWYFGEHTLHFKKPPSYHFFTTMFIVLLLAINLFVYRQTFAQT